MSKEVKRYDYGYVDDGNGNRYLGLIEKHDGNLVKHEDYKALLDEVQLLKSQERYREQELLAALEEVEKLKRELALWEPVIYEVHRRADKMCCLEGRYDFTVEIPYDTYAAIDNAM